MGRPHSGGVPNSFQKTHPIVHLIHGPMPSTRLKLSSVGHIAISTENDTNLSIVGVVMFMKGKMPPKTVTRLIQERIIPRFSRFSSLVNDQKEFSPLENYDCSSHVSNSPSPLDFYFLIGKGLRCMLLMSLTEWTVTEVFKNWLAPCTIDASPWTNRCGMWGWCI